MGRNCGDFFVELNKLDESDRDEVWAWAQGLNGHIDNCLKEFQEVIIPNLRALPPERAQVIANAVRECFIGVFLHAAAGISVLNTDSTAFFIAQAVVSRAQAEENAQAVLAAEAVKNPFSNISNMSLAQAAKAHSPEN